MQSGALEHHRSARDTTRHLEFWRERLGKYALVHLTPEHLGKERQLLVDTPTHRNTKRTSATVNRYIASLSAALTYACRQLRWIDDNPCFNLIYELNLLFQSRNPSKLLIFASKTPFGKIDINKPWNEALKQAGIEGFVFHSIRHHFATLAARSGASNLQLKTALGHKTLQMLERYTHLDVETTRHLSLTVSQKILGSKND